MSIPAQGAVGAETMTAGRIAHDAAYGLKPDSQLWQGQTEGVREFWNRAGAAVVSALASPRADSDERAAGGWRKVMRDLISEHDKHVCLHEETHRGGAIWTICDHCGRKWADDEGGFQPYEEPAAVTAAWALLKCEEATPAQPAGAVPDGLRALSEDETKRIVREEMAKLWDAEEAPSSAAMIRAGKWDDTDPVRSAIQGALFLREAIASHPAGQSAGSGAEDAGLKDAIAEIVRRAEKDQTFLRRTLARMRAEQEPAPDSTRTGQGEAEELREEVAYWRRDLAARLWSMTALYKAALDRGEGDRAADLANALRSALASYHDAENGEWYERCELCGEFVRDGEPRAAWEDVSGHARCLSEDGNGHVDPHGDEDLARWVGEAQAALDAPRPEVARPAAPEAQGAERVRHVKRGTEYEVLGEAEAQVSRGMRINFGAENEGLYRHLHEGMKLTVYRGSDGKLWCRFTDEMRDGRFVPAPPASSGQGGR